MTEDRDPAEMHRTTSADPRRSYARLGDDGTLYLIANGKGLSIRLGAAELREFARVALGVADKLDAGAEAAGADALQALARIAT